MRKILKKTAFLLAHIKICGLMGLLFLISSLKAECDELILPKGISSASLSCDFTTELTFPVAKFPIGLNKETSTVVLFGRYWVTPDVIRMEILWSEPPWSGNPFPEYPPGLICVYTKKNFIITQSRRGKTSGFSMPFGERPKADRVDGSWDMSHMRYAWSEYLDSIKYANDLTNAFLEDQVKNNDSTNFLQIRNGQLLELGSKNFNDQKEIKYQYLTNNGGVYLDKQQITLKEYPIPATGLINQASFNGKNISTNRNILYHEQGRLSEVQWSVKIVGNKKVLTPDKIEVKVPPPIDTFTGETRTEVQKVWNNKGELETERDLRSNVRYNAYTELGDNPIRKTTLSRYSILDSSCIIDLTNTVPIYNGIGLNERQWYNQIEAKFWKIALPQTNINQLIIKQYLKQMDEDCLRAITPVEKLKCNYTRIISSLIIGDIDLFTNLLDEYIVNLRDAGVEHLTPNCLLSLKRLCSTWGREDFSKIVQDRLNRFDGKNF